MSEVTSEQRTATERGRRSPLAHLLLLPITIYRWTAPLRAPRCRFYPSCSSYAVEAIRVHGALRGAWLGARRLLRCHPWNDGGVDHVPPRRTTSPSPDAAATRVRPAGTPPISSRK